MDRFYNIFKKRKLKFLKKYAKILVKNEKNYQICQKTVIILSVG